MTVTAFCEWVRSKHPTALCESPDTYSLAVVLPATVTGGLQLAVFRQGLRSLASGTTLLVVRAPSADSPGDFLLDWCRGPRK